MSMSDDVVSDLSGRINKTIDDLRVALSKLRTGRASITLLDGIHVDYYGTATPLQGVAQLHVADARLITIKPWDKSQIPMIQKAIENAQLGINPVADGEMVRLPFPPLTEERRRDLAKTVKQRGEEHKVAVRNERRDAKEMIEDLVKEGDLDEDGGDKSLAAVQALVDEGVKKIDEVCARKEKELMEV